MSMQGFNVRNAFREEFAAIGQLMVDVYSQLEGFPTPAEQPKYYEMLGHVGELTQKPGVELLVAVNDQGELGGAVVYFADMAQYGSGGTATKEINTSGFRLLAVSHDHRGKGLGKLLTQACIALAQEHKKEQIVIHSTKAMQVAWSMYERLGFVRAEVFDFVQGELPVFGFRMKLT